MYANDHGPVKHFHAEYNGHWAKYSFDGDLIKGGLPRKQERLVLARAGLGTVLWGDGDIDVAPDTAREEAVPLGA